MVETIEGEATPVNGPEPSAVMVRPQHEVLNVDQALKEWEAYQDLTKRLLSAEDYQKIGDSKFKKKSAWRKYARAFNISCEVVYEDIVRAPDGYPLFARVRVRATDPSGRFQETDQECHINERCKPCEQPCSKASWAKHTCCVSGCDGRVHFSHPGDLPATATTRAKNRAISDLIGAGEVSYEEMQGTGQEDAPKKAAPRSRPSPPKGQPAGATQALYQALVKNYHRADNENAADWAEIRAYLERSGAKEAMRGMGLSLNAIPEEKQKALIKELSAMAGAEPAP